MSEGRRRGRSRGRAKANRHGLIDDDLHHVNNNNNSNSNNARNSDTGVSLESTQASAGAYVPPSLHGIDNGNFFVTRPPPKSSLTGNISSLFRRSASRDRKPPPQTSNQPTGTITSSETRLRGIEDPTSPSAAHPLTPHRRSFPLQRSTSQGSRVFYSSHDDEDEDTAESYRSRTNQSQNTGNDTRSTRTRSTEDYSKGFGDVNTSATTESTATATGTIGTILRFRGFSTSIQSLFLDEALVCAAMGCFGLILSNRTEYLLQLRNDRRGVRWGRSTSRRTLPSRIVAYALLLTILLVFGTFIIWGFGSHNATSFSGGFYDGYGDDANSQYNNNNYGYDDDAQQQGDDNNNRILWFQQPNITPVTSPTSLHTMHSMTAKASSETHKIKGIFKIRDMQDTIWRPTIEFFTDEWYQGTDPTSPVRSLKQNRNANGAYYSSQQNQDSGRDLAADLRVAFLIAFLVVLGVLGRRRRMRTRYYLVRARAQEDHLFYASSGSGVKRVAFQDSREDQYEGACSHTLCGCYPVDPPMDGDEIDDEVKVDDHGVTQVKKKQHHHDCVSRGFNCLMACCCGLLCRCWCQCMSICALAQEAREIRLLVPTRYQRVDFITHQPFHEYQKNVNELRRAWLGKSRKKFGFMSHFSAISRLSRYILAWFIVIFLIITATLIFNPRASFSWPDMVILIATFGQSFLVIYLVHWIFHKSDLSLDAVIKFFATGFVIAVPAAFFFEGLLVNITLTIAYTGWAVGERISDTFSIWVVDNYKWIWIVSELFNAYVVAAITEELCKYYTFRGVEHPDLIFLTGLAKSSQDERAVAGGIVKYPFGSHQVQQTNKRRDYDDADDDDRSVSSRASHRSTSRSRSRSRSMTRTRSNSGLVTNNLDLLGSEEDFAEEDEEEHDIRTHRQKAAAVTTAMISVAVGLACAENFLYVFLLGGSEANSGDVQSGGVIEEWIVLLFRSLFPVHALAAAMQSINVVRKYVECETDNSHRIGVGRIILPAVIMHGTFDAVLLAVNIYIETAWDVYLAKNEGNFDPNNPPYNPVMVNLVAWLSLIFVMVSGLMWYFRQNRLQSQRLAVLEEKEKAAMEVNASYRNPRGIRAGEVELV